MDAKVEVRVQYGVFAPSGDPTHVVSHELVACTPDLAWFTDNIADAKHWANRMNQKLRSYGVNNEFRVVKRNVTIVTSEWE